MMSIHPFGRNNIDLHGAFVNLQFSIIVSHTLSKINGENLPLIGFLGIQALQNTCKMTPRIHFDFDTHDFFLIQDVARLLFLFSLLRSDFSKEWWKMTCCQYDSITFEGSRIVRAVCVQMGVEVKYKENYKGDFERGRPLQDSPCFIILESAAAWPVHTMLIINIGATDCGMTNLHLHPLQCYT